MTNRFSAWREQLAADLATAEAARTTAVAALAAAEEAARAAKIERRELAEAFDRLGARTSVAGTLLDLKRRTEDELGRPEGAVSLARQNLKNAERYGSDLRLALDQLDVIHPPIVTEPELEGAA